MLSQIILSVFALQTTLIINSCLVSYTINYEFRRHFLSEIISFRLHCYCFWKLWRNYIPVLENGFQASSNVINGKQTFSLQGSFREWPRIHWDKAACMQSLFSRRCSFWFSFIFSIVSIISMVALNRPFAIFTQLNFNPFLQFKLTLE